MVMPFSSAASRATGDRRAVVVGAVAGNIDDAAQAPMRIFLEQRHREIDRARDRGARRPADRGFHDFGGNRVRRFRSVDHPPGNDDLLVARCRPLEIGHRNLAVRAGLQRLQKFLGDDGLRVALALDGEFVHVHRIGDIDGENQFDIDRRHGFLDRPDRVSGVRRGDAGDVAPGYRPRDKHGSDRDTPAHSGPPVI